MREARTVCWSTLPGDSAAWDAVLAGRSSEPAGPLDHAIEGEAWEVIRMALDRLPGRQRMVVGAATWRAPRPRRVRGMLGLSQGNQRVLLHRGRARVRGAARRRPRGRRRRGGRRTWRGRPAGSVLPDVALPDTTGTPRRLSDLSAGDPMVLHTYRGSFCPKERAYSRQVLLPLQEVAEVGYVRMVSVSVEPPEVTGDSPCGSRTRLPP